MSRAHSQNQLLNTLGFFLQGIPVIFVQTDIALLSHPLIRYYATVAKQWQEKRHPVPDFSESRLCSGYELAISITHELRHFHDALLSAPLFEMFLQQTIKLIYVIQLPAFLDVHLPTLPISLPPKDRSFSAEARLLLNLIHKHDSLYKAQYREWWLKTCDLDNRRITVRHLLETNAMLGELIHLMVDYGNGAANNYYENVVLNLPEEYSFLLGWFCSAYNDLQVAITVLYVLIPYCLFGRRPAADTFELTVKDCGMDAQKILEMCGPASLMRLFEEGENLESRIAGIDSEELKELQAALSKAVFGQKIIEEVFGLHKIMYRCRGELVRKYISEFRYNAQLYCERIDELPSPPVLFFPPGGACTEDVVRGVLESELRQSGIPYRVIYGQRLAREEMVVAAGLRPYCDVPPSISFEAADVHLASRYFYRRLFEAPGVMYSEVLDEVYERLFMETFVNRLKTQ